MTKRSPVPRRGWIWLLVFAIFVVLALVRVAFFFGIETPIEPPATMPLQLPSDVPHSTLQATSSPTLFIPTPLPGERLSTIRYDRLPTEGQEVIALIARGGPFPYDQDGSTFQNRERLLPIQPSGYYKEYTVETPGSSDRGARRIVVGLQGELYYTADHYASFMRVIP